MSYIIEKILCDFTEIVAITMGLQFIINFSMIAGKKKLVALYYMVVLCFIVCNQLFFSENILLQREVYFLSLSFILIGNWKDLKTNFIWHLIICLAESLVCGYVGLAILIVYGKKFPDISGDGISFLITLVFPLIELAYWSIHKLLKKELNCYILTNLQKGMLLISFFCNMIVTIIIMWSIQYQEFSFKNYLIQFLFFLVFSLLFVIFMLFQAKSAWKNQKLLEEQTNYERVTKAQESYLNYVIKRDDDLRKFRHDIRAHMIILSDMIDKNQNYEAGQYLKKIEEIVKVNLMKQSSGNITLDAVLNNLYEQIENNSIKFQIDGLLQNISQELSFDLSICIYNLLLNAIEACERMKDNDREILLELKQYQQRLYIRVKNSCENIENAEDIQQLNTSKVDRKNHGYGSRNVKEIVQKYQGRVVYSVKDNYFISEILM